MNIGDIATREYLETAPDERVGEVRTMLEADTTSGVLVVVGNEPVGVITPRELLRSRVDDDTAVDAVMSEAPTVERETDVREVARLLVESGSRIVAVMEGGNLWGSVTADDLLGAVTENLDVLEVRQIHTEAVETVTEEATMGEVINAFREHGISRLPVVEENGRLAGIVTVRDLVEFVVREPSQPGSGERAGDKEPLLELPIRNVASRPVETTTPTTPVGDAVETMLDRDYDGLVVVPEYDELVAGILTKTDVLRALTYTGEEHPDVGIANVELLERTTREDVSERLAEIAGKHREMKVHHTDVRLQKHDEELRGRQLIRCKVRMRTDQDTIIATGEGYGAEDALSIALDKLERSVLELKGRRHDEQYRGQLLRKLGEL